MGVLIRFLHYLQQLEVQGVCYKVSVEPCLAKVLRMLRKWYGSPDEDDEGYLQQLALSGLLLRNFV